MHQLLYKAYKHLDYTQQELSDITGYDKTQLNRWLNAGKAAIERGEDDDPVTGVDKLLNAIQKTAKASGEKWIEFLQARDGEQGLQAMRNITFFDMKFRALENQSIWSINTLPIEVNNLLMRDYVFEQLFKNQKYPNLQFTYWVPKSSKEEMCGFLRHLKNKLSKETGETASQEDVLKKITVVLSPMALCMRNMLILVDNDRSGRPKHKYAIRNARNTYDYNFSKEDIAASLVAKFESSNLFNYLATIEESIKLGDGKFVDSDSAEWCKLTSFEETKE